MRAVFTVDSVTPKHGGRYADVRMSHQHAPIALDDQNVHFATPRDSIMVVLTPDDIDDAGGVPVVGEQFTIAFTAVAPVTDEVSVASDDVAGLDASVVGTIVAAAAPSPAAPQA